MLYTLPFVLIIMFVLESFSDIKAFLLVLCYPCDINSIICDFFANIYINLFECDCYCFKTLLEIFHFRFRSGFFAVYSFVHQNASTFWLQNIITPFKIKIIKKPHLILLPDVWFLSSNKKVWNSIISAWVGAPQKWPSEKFFRSRKSKFWERLNSKF